MSTGETGGTSFLPEVELFMTPLAYQKAREAGVESITPNVPAMGEIAQILGGKLLPTVVVMRFSGDGYTLVNNWDALLTNWRANEDYSVLGAASLSLPQEKAERIPMNGLGAIAGRIGATSLTEVSVPDFRADLRGPFAVGLVSGQRPRPLAPGESRDPIGVALWRLWVRTYKGLGNQGRLNRAESALAQAQNPFTVTYRR